ncbi:MAG: hypothetical protein ACREVH_13900 [Gammaproteobacteria bacterium]
MNEVVFEPEARAGAASTDPRDIQAALLKLLAQAQDPMPASKLSGSLRKRYGLSPEAFEALLVNQVRLGTVFRHPPLRNEGARYWDRDRGRYLDTLIERELSAAALPIQTLRGRVAKRVRDVSEGELSVRVGALLRAGRLHELPRIKGKRAARLSAKPPDPKDYLGATIQRLVHAIEEESLRLAAFGVPCAASFAAARALLERSALYGPPAAEEHVATPSVDGAATEQDLEQQILEQLQRLSADLRHGGLVSTRELRAAQPRFAQEHAAFDRALLRLAKDGKVWLFRHDFPASLTESERKAMVTDGRGNYYNGISFKE